MGLKDGISASRIGFGPLGWDLGLKTGIWALRLEFGPWDWDLRGGGRRRRRRRRRKKSPICVKAKVIDPFGAAAQKTANISKKVWIDRPTDQRTDTILQSHVHEIEHCAGTI